MSSRSFLFPMKVECLEEGGYFARCPVLPGCHVQVFLKSYRELGKEIPRRIRRIRGSAIVSGGIPVRVKDVG